MRNFYEEHRTSKDEELLIPCSRDVLKQRMTQWALTHTGGDIGKAGDMAESLVKYILPWGEVCDRIPPR